MSKLQLTLVTKDYGQYWPIRTGDVTSPDIDLTIDRDTYGAMDRSRSDENVLLGEFSLARQIVRLSEGNDSVVALPFFPNRSLQFRLFFVRKGSDIRTLADLKGKKVGTNDWPATGNTWKRKYLYDAGVDIDQIKWFVGEVPGAVANGRPQGDLPPFVTDVRDQKVSLLDLLKSGEIDALMGAGPKEADDAESGIVRLYEDYRSVEQAYYRRTGIFPIHHFIGVRRSLFERHPEVVRSLYELLENSKQYWKKTREEGVAITDSTPWYDQDLRETRRLIGHDWQPRGVAANRRTIEILLAELRRQLLLKSDLTVDKIFADFTSIYGES